MAWACFIYLFGCYVALGFLLFGGDGDDRSWVTIKQAFAAASPWRKALMALLLVLVFLVIGPLMLLFFVHCLWVTQRESKFWKRFARQHRDVIMDPIPFDAMNAAGRSFVMQHARAIDALSFRVHGNYLYKANPLPIESRFYLSEDGRTILTIGHIDGEEYYSLTSFLSGGAGIETSVVRHPIDVDDINTTCHYYAQSFDLEAGADVGAMYAEHEAMLDELSAKTGQAIMAMRHDQLVPAVRYANRRFAATKHLLGKLDQTPPPAEWPFGNQNEEMVTV